MIRWALGKAICGDTVRSLGEATNRAVLGPLIYKLCRTRSCLRQEGYKDANRGVGGRTGTRATIVEMKVGPWFFGGLSSREEREGILRLF